MISESIANAFEEEKNLVKICSVSDLTMCVKIQELASDATSVSNKVLTSRKKPAVWRRVENGVHGICSR